MSRIFSDFQEQKEKIIFLNIKSIFAYVYTYIFQIYYCEYYGKYLEEYERRRMMNVGPTDEALVESSINSVTPLEASILMDDIMNNGMTFCSIM